MTLGSESPLSNRVLCSIDSRAGERNERMGEWRKEGAGENKEAAFIQQLLCA